MAEVRGMALDTIAKMVKAAGPAQIQPHLADLSVTMLESLSGMEVISITDYMSISFKFSHMHPRFQLDVLLCLIFHNNCYGSIIFLH